MESGPKPWAVGDPCPNCEGELRYVPQPTDAQRADAANRDNPVPIPPTRDTAPAAFVAAKGDLHRCPACGYQARVEPAPATT